MVARRHRREGEKHEQAQGERRGKSEGVGCAFLPNERQGAHKDYRSYWCAVLVVGKSTGLFRTKGFPGSIRMTETITEYIISLMILLFSSRLPAYLSTELL